MTSKLSNYPENILAISIKISVISDKLKNLPEIMHSFEILFGHISDSVGPTIKMYLPSPKKYVTMGIDNGPIEAELLQT
jgi:hypothetical protein